MRCEECRGACCEEIMLHVLVPDDKTLEWLEARTASNSPEVQDRTFECACPKLREGRCSIYADRPKICAEYERGGVECLLTVMRRRTPEQYQRIREEGDPNSLEEIQLAVFNRRSVAAVRDPAAKL